MPKTSSLPHLKESQIKQLASSQSYERGEDYTSMMELSKTLRFKGINFGANVTDQTDTIQA